MFQVPRMLIHVHKYAKACKHLTFHDLSDISKIPSRFGGEMLQDPALNFVLSQTIVYLACGSWS